MDKITKAYCDLLIDHPAYEIKEKELQKSLKIQEECFNKLPIKMKHLRIFKIPLNCLQPPL